MKEDCVITNWHYHTVSKRKVGEGFNIYRLPKLLIFFLFSPVSLGELKLQSEKKSKENKEEKPGLKKIKQKCMRYEKKKQVLGVINGIKKVSRGIRKEQTLLLADSSGCDGGPEGFHFTRSQFI